MRKVFFDIETTGLDCWIDRITQIGLVVCEIKGREAEIRLRFTTNVKRGIREIRRLMKAGYEFIEYSAEGFDKYFIKQYIPNFDAENYIEVNEWGRWRKLVIAYIEKEGEIPEVIRRIVRRLEIHNALCDALMLAGVYLIKMGVKKVRLKGGMAIKRAKVIGPQIF